MSLKQICCGSFAALIFFIHGLTAIPSQAGLRDHCIGDQTGCCKRCPACNHCCKLDAEEVDEEKTCFEVESKVICIPRVVFPWQKKTCRSCDSCSGLGCNNCVHNGAKVRRICVLKTKKYSCPKCKYTWTPQENACDSGCCDTVSNAGLGSDIAATGVVTQPMQQDGRSITSSNQVTRFNSPAPVRGSAPSALSPQSQQGDTQPTGLVPINVRPLVSQPGYRSAWPTPLPTVSAN